MDPYVGEIRLFAGSYAPARWALCQGQLLPVQTFETLFALLGTTYGGDGSTTFGLPDLRGRVPVHESSAHPLGSTGGAEFVNLGVPNIAKHDHAFNATTALANQPAPGGNVPAQSATIQLYTEDQPSFVLSGSALVPFDAGGQPHDNMIPFQALSFIIALEGAFPSRP
jgi:microcystin-dependent protein